MVLAFLFLFSILGFDASNGSSPHDRLANPPACDLFDDLNIIFLTDPFLLHALPLQTAESPWPDGSLGSSALVVVVVSAAYLFKYDNSRY